MVKESEIGQLGTGLRPEPKPGSESKSETEAQPEARDKLEKLRLSPEELCRSCLDMPETQRGNIILEIQQLAEKILKIHRVLERPEDLLKEDWFLKLGKPGFEKKLVISKSAEEIFLGLYSYRQDTPIPDPILVLLSQNGFWYPQRIEEEFDETICSFFTGAYGDYEFLNVLPENLIIFQVFQRNFSKVLEEQGWASSDVEVIEKIMPRESITFP